MKSHVVRSFQAHSWVEHTAVMRTQAVPGPNELAVAQCGRAVFATALWWSGRYEPKAC